MRIETGLKLGFKDVMIRPKRSTLSSRSQVSLDRTFTFLHSSNTWTGIPIMAANMDTVGTFEMAKTLAKHKIFTAIHKHYSIEEWDDFIASLPFEAIDYFAVSTGTGNPDSIKLETILNKHPQIKFICIDVANGYSEHFVDFVQQTRKKYPDKVIIAGEVYKVKNVERDEKMTLQTPLSHDVELAFIGLPVVDGIPFIVFWLVLGAVFFTFKMNFVNLRGFKHAIELVRGKYDKPEDEGEVSHFQALATALSGTVGTGNIGGVALAIFLGGPAALFWMWATAFFGMTTKFVEVTLSHKYREKTADGTMAGGPMYYMDKRLNMKWLAVIFAIATVISSFGTGNLPQSNSIAITMQATFGFEPWIVGSVLAILLGLVILGGITRIAAVTSKVVPLMAVIYLVGAFAVIFANIENVGPAFISIFTDAFTGSAAAGGFLGATFAYAFNRGVNRGLFSNEAGQGSAPIAHAAAKTEEPVSEGMVSILEPFIDTIIICTIISSNSRTSSCR